MLGTVFVKNSLANESFDRILECLGCAELLHTHFLDQDRLSRTRIATHATFAGLRFEYTESCYGDLFAFFEGISYHCNHRLDGAFCVRLGAADGLMHAIDQISLICHTKGFKKTYWWIKRAVPSLDLPAGTQACDSL